MKVVFMFVEEMGLKVFFLEKVILFVLVYFVFEKIEEVLCIFWILVFVEFEVWLWLFKLLRIMKIWNIL